MRELTFFNSTCSSCPVEDYSLTTEVCSHRDDHDLFFTAKATFPWSFRRLLVEALRVSSLPISVLAEAISLTVEFESDIVDELGSVLEMY